MQPRKYFLGSLLLFCAFTTISSAQSQRWTEAQAGAWYDHQPWLVGSNYIPATAINQLEMWQADTFDPKRIDLELGWAESLGFNPCVFSFTICFGNQIRADSKSASIRFWPSPINITSKSSSCSLIPAGIPIRNSESNTPPSPVSTIRVGCRVRGLPPCRILRNFRSWRHT